jgi:hypothetical protein
VLGFVEDYPEIVTQLISTGHIVSALQSTDNVDLVELLLGFIERNPHLVRGSSFSRNGLSAREYFARLQGREVMPARLIEALLESPFANRFVPNREVGLRHAIHTLELDLEIFRRAFERGVLIDEGDILSIFETMRAGKSLEGLLCLYKSLASFLGRVLTLKQSIVNPDGIYMIGRIERAWLAERQRLHSAILHAMQGITMERLLWFYESNEAFMRSIFARRADFAQVPEALATLDELEALWTSDRRFLRLAPRPTAGQAHVGTVGLAAMLLRLVVSREMGK